MVISTHLSCTTCGTDNPPQAAFCFACGQPFHASTIKPHPSSRTGTLSGGQVMINHAPAGLLVSKHLLNRRYRIISQVGKGGFGAVYKAEDSLFGNRLVAVKEMSHGRGDGLSSPLSPQEVAMATDAFKREALLLANLAHPGLPHIYDQFFEVGHWYLVMDFIEGETLDEQLHKAKM